MPVGGVRQRFDALVAGTAAATILVPPFIDMALGQGFAKLWSGEEVAPAYPGVVAAARAAWLGANEDAAVRYLGALLEANAWGTDAANAHAAVAALVAAGYTEAAGTRLVRDAVAGLEPSRPGWDEVVSLRRECGLLPSPEPEAGKVIDSRAARSRDRFAAKENMIRC